MVGLDFSDQFTIPDCVVQSQLNMIFTNFINDSKPKVPKVQYNMAIKLVSDKTIKHTLRKLSKWETDQIEANIADLLERGVIEECNSPYASRIVPVRKKDNSIRMCIDYRELNKITVADCYPLPIIEELLDKLRAKRIYSLIDLKDGFYHVNIEPKSRDYTAFVSTSGQYRYTRLPFGLKNGPASFSRLIRNVFKDLI